MFLITNSTKTFLKNSLSAGTTVENVSQTTAATTAETSPTEETTTEDCEEETTSTETTDAGMRIDQSINCYHFFPTKTPLTVKLDVPTDPIQIRLLLGPVPKQQKRPQPEHQKVVEQQQEREWRAQLVMTTLQVHRYKLT